MLDRVHQAFLDSGLGDPAIRFNFGDAMAPGFTSSVDRVLKPRCRTTCRRKASCEG